MHLLRSSLVYGISITRRRLEYPIPPSGPNVLRSSGLSLRISCAVVSTHMEADEFVNF